MVHWYVIQSKPQKEAFLMHQLSLHNIESYYPCIRSRRSHSLLLRKEPYFPGYIFLHTDLQRVGISSLRWMPGSLGLVCFGGEPGMIPDGFIQSIRQAVARAEVDVASVQSFITGQKVRIQEGSLKGYEAIFNTYLSGEDRVRLLICLAHNNAQVSVTIPAKYIV
jgi:transcriptional antiterminator RfaH